MHVLVHYLIDQTLLTEYTTAIRRASSPSLHFAKSLSAARAIKKLWIVAKIIWRVVLSSLDGYASNIGPWEQVLCNKCHEEANRVCLICYDLWICNRSSCNYHTWKTVQRAQDVVDKVVRKIPSIQVLLGWEVTPPWKLLTWWKRWWWLNDFISGPW